MNVLTCFLDSRSQQWGRRCTIWCEHRSSRANSARRIGEADVMRAFPNSPEICVARSARWMCVCVFPNVGGHAHPTMHFELCGSRIGRFEQRFHFLTRACARTHWRPWELLWALNMLQHFCYLLGSSGVHPWPPSRHVTRVWGMWKVSSHKRCTWQGWHVTVTPAPPVPPVPRVPPFPPVPPVLPNRRPLPLTAAAHRRPPPKISYVECSRPEHSMHGTFQAWSIACMECSRP